MARVFEPIRIGNMEVKNRMVAAPTVVAYADEHGYVTQRLMDIYAERAKGGAGLIIVEATYVRQDGRMFSRMLGIHTEYHVIGLSELADIIHQAGARAALQIMHGGRQAPPHITGGQPVAPSDCAPLMGVVPRVLSTEECEELADCFATAALRVKNAGFDAVMFHGTHGFLLQQFMSPYTNNRTDKYGDRLAFVSEVLAKTRNLVGKDFPIIYRAAADEFLGDKGITLDMFTKEIVPALLKGGVDCLDITGGVFETLDQVIGSLYSPRGFMVPLAEATKEVANVPVAIAGRINDPKLAEKLISDGKVDLVALSRPLLADPAFVRKMEQGKEKDIRKCIACNACMPLGERVSRCAVNPELGRERIYQIWPALALKHKKVLVVGGGVAGMEAARVAALRGHAVSLWEKKDRLGGLVSLAAAMPRLFTRELNNIVEWLSDQIRQLPVNIQLNKEATIDEIIKYQPDVLILAVGSHIIPPPLPGMDRPSVITLDQYLAGQANLGEKVAVIGAAYGTEVAVSLIREGKKVTVLEEGGPEQLLGAPYMDVIRMIALPKLVQEHQIPMCNGIQIKEITEKGVEYRTAEGKDETLEVDNVILAIRRQPHTELAKSLRGKISELYEIGDCRSPGRILSAVHDGAYVGREI
jgi:2,4-dienoyl-CoA reductase-like NADH-dependent reductase (Old Yellow Enzyme family)/thioredoxin reductase